MFMKRLVKKAVFICTLCLAASAQYTCVLQNPLPAMKDLNFIISNGSRYLAGGNGVLLASLNGWHWTSIDSIKASDTLISAVWTGTQFVMIDVDGWIMRSPDGLNWIRNEEILRFGAKSLAWTGSRIVAVGGNGNVGFASISSDGINWTTPEKCNSAYNLTSVTWTGSRLYAVGGNVITSIDGTNWTRISSQISNCYESITWTGSKLRAVGSSQVATSSDGEVWSYDTLPTSHLLTSITSIGSQIVVGSREQAIFTSSGDKIWNERELDYTGESVNYVNHIGNRCYAVGNKGTMYISEDGITWCNRQPRNTLFSVIWTGELFVGVGASTILTSTDGYLWTERFHNINCQFQSVAGQGSNLVAVGFNGKIYSSSDGGINWTEQKQAALLWLNAVIWTGNFFVAAGSDGTALTSPDGVTWTTRPTGTSNTLTSITWTGSKLVVTGPNNEDTTSFLTSEDGISWTKHRYPILKYVNWTGSRLLGLGLDKSLYVSNDGENWTQQNIKWSAGLVNSVLWTGHEYIAAGDINGRSAICISSNDSLWRDLSLIAWESSRTLHSMATNGKTIVAVGDLGLIFTCEPDNGSKEKISHPHFSRQESGNIVIDNNRENRIGVKTSDLLTGKSVSFQICSISGRCLWSSKGAGGSTFHIPTSSFSPGRYFLVAKWNEGKQVCPFIVDMN